MTFARGLPGPLAPDLMSPRWFRKHFRPACREAVGPRQTRQKHRWGTHVMNTLWDELATPDLTPFVLFAPSALSHLI
jgi:hypothetical protein